MIIPSSQDVFDAVAGVPDATQLAMVLAAGGDANARIGGRPALDYAVMLGYEEKVRLLLRYGADPNLHEDPDPKEDGRFVTPLIVAVRNDERLGIIKMLIEARADPDQAANLGMTPLMCAATMRSTASFNLLLSLGANPNIETPEKQTALHFAMLRDSPAIVRRLIQLGLDPNAGQNRSGDGLEKTARNPSLARRYGRPIIRASRGIMRSRGHP
jgi:ankyrin repeat protein